MQRHNVFRTDRIKVTERLLERSPSSRILEIGSGDYSFDYIYSGKEKLWVKVDFFPPSDIICDLNVENLDLPIADTSFDLIICTEVLEHLLWPQSLLSEMRRVLTNKGKILISVPNIASLTYRLAWLVGHLPSCAASGNIPVQLGSTAYNKGDSSSIGGHVIDFTLKRIMNLLEFSGYKLCRAKGSGIIWHRQILPYWFVPVSLASNIICIAEKNNLYI